MSDRRAVIWGGAGHAKVVADLAREHDYDIVGFIDDVDPSRAGEGFAGATVLGGRERLDDLRREGVVNLFLGFGDNRGRLRIAELARAHGFALPTLIHRSVSLSSGVRFGDGCVVVAGGYIGVDASFGDAVIVNGLAGIGHDVIVGAGAHVGGGTMTAGHAVLGECVTLHPNVTVARALTIGAETVVGAGAVVVRDLPERVLALGAPARVVRSLDDPQ